MKSKLLLTVAKHNFLYSSSNIRRFMLSSYFLSSRCYVMWLSQLISGSEYLRKLTCFHVQPKAIDTQYLQMIIPTVCGEEKRSNETIFKEKMLLKINKTLIYISNFLQRLNKLILSISAIYSNKHHSDDNTYTSVLNWASLFC